MAMTPLYRRLTWEAAALAVVLLGVLVWRGQPPPAAPAGQVAWTATASDAGVMRGALTPALAGLNELEARLTDADGRPLQRAQVDVQFLPVGGGALIVRRPLTEAAPGVYRASAITLSRAGAWQMLLSVTAPAAPVAFATVDWRLDPDGVIRLAATPSPASAAWVGWWRTAGEAGVSVAVLALVAGWSWWAWRRLPGAVRQMPGWWAAPGLLGVALVGLALALLRF